jgi:hypothetical protein
MSTQPKAGAVLFAKDVARLAAFYAQVLAVVPKHAHAEKVVIEAEDFLLVIHADSPSHGQGGDHAPPVLRENVPVKLFLPVFAGPGTPEHRAARRWHEARAAEWNGPDFRACDGFDPEGNVVQFREVLPEPAWRPEHVPPFHSAKKAVRLAPDGFFLRCRAVAAVACAYCTASLK